MNNEHPIENLMQSTMAHLKEMIDVNTIIGDTVETKDGSYIIPISKVSFGFASGGSEFGKSETNNVSSQSFPFGGGSGAGVTLKPQAFLVVKENSVRLLPVEIDTPIDRLVNTIPQVMDTLIELLNKDSKKKKKNDKTEMDSTNTCSKLNQ